MDPSLKRLLCNEVAHQCKTLLIEADASDSALRGPDGTAVWAHIQGVLIAAANISKLFWGSGGKKAEERRELRELLGITDDSVLRDPDLRNDFEHFDERLKDWYEEGSGMFVGRNIGPPGDYNLGTDPETWFHHYDPTTGMVSFQGHAMSLRDIVSEAERILPLAEREFMRGMTPPFGDQESEGGANGT